MKSVKFEKLDLHEENLLSRDEMKEVNGGDDGTMYCNCYSNNEPENGDDMECNCGDTIQACCGSGYTGMNCYGC